MFTKRLYFENAYIKEFDARVLSCEEGKNGYEIVLDETAFFPEGGGQPADQGYLEDGEVTDVRVKKKLCPAYLHQIPGAGNYGARKARLEPAVPSYAAAFRGTYSFRDYS